MLLVLGTRNQKKWQEIVEILGGLGLDLRDLTGWPDLHEVEETGTTFEENARLKATAVARGTGHWAIGEDSGLVVPALGGAPGVFSARFAGKQGDDTANNSKLLTELDGVPDEKRVGYYVCKVAMADPSGEVKAVTEGRCHGIIMREPRGHGGFGYDPLFLIPEYHRTFGQMSTTVKHALSHRARALAKLRPVLREIFKA